jgi:hypothetical protein
MISAKLSGALTSHPQSIVDNSISENPAFDKSVSAISRLAN